MVAEQLLIAEQKLQIATEKISIFEDAIKERNCEELFSYFKDAIILIGPVDKIFQDLAPTPFENNPEPKVAVHSNMVKTILSGLHPKTVNPWIEYLLACVNIYCNTYLCL